MGMGLGFVHRISQKMKLGNWRQNMSMRSWLGFVRSLLIYGNPQRQIAWGLFYRQNLRAGEVVFDIGTHVGSRARAMRAAGVKVIAYEPQEPFTKFLRWSLPADITLVSAAVGSRNAEAELAISTLHPTVSSLSADFPTAAAKIKGFEHVRWDKLQKVRVVTLDSQIAEFGIPSYVKIDVEGFELEVLAGLSKPLAMLSVEFLPGFQSLTLKVLDRLSQLGDYRFNPVIGERAKFLWPEWRDIEAVKQWLEALPVNTKSGDLFARLAEETNQPEDKK